MVTGCETPLPDPIKHLLVSRFYSMPFCFRFPYVFRLRYPAGTASYKGCAYVYLTNGRN